jgi:hypothetical protein
MEQGTREAFVRIDKKSSSSTDIGQSQETSPGLQRGKKRKARKHRKGCRMCFILRVHANMNGVHIFSVSFKNPG